MHACMYVQYVCMHVCMFIMYFLVGFPGTIVIDGYEPPCGDWKPNLGPLQDRQVPLTTEPSF